MPRERHKLWVGKTDTAMPHGDVRLRIARRYNERCARCSNALGTGPWDLDHVIPLEDGGMNAEGNLQPLCKPCHGMKTRAENSERAKVRRKAKAHLGIDKRAYRARKLSGAGFVRKPKNTDKLPPPPPRDIYQRGNLLSVGQSDGD